MLARIRQLGFFMGDGRLMFIYNDRFWSLSLLFFRLTYLFHHEKKRSRVICGIDLVGLSVIVSSSHPRFPIELYFSFLDWLIGYTDWQFAAHEPVRRMTHRDQHIWVQGGEVCYTYSWLFPIYRRLGWTYLGFRMQAPDPISGWYRVSCHYGFSTEGTVHQVRDKQLSILPSTSDNL